MRRAVFLLLCLTMAAACQPVPTASLAPMNFLLGTWSARTMPAKGVSSTVLGEYTFRTDLLKNVVTRVSSTDACVAPQSLDCQHYDAFTVYRDQGDPALHALSLDSQGHTIHYNVSFPDSTTAIFFSVGPGTQTRLVYHLQKNTLTGKLQTAPPGSTNFVSTLEWFGVRMNQNEPVPGGPAASHALESLENTTRILFVFAPQSADANLKQQLAALSTQETGLTERDLIVIPVLALWTPADKDLYDRNLPFSAPEEQRYARSRFKIPGNAFSVLLVGKDGGEKLRSRTPVTAARLFSTIDGMPMRRQEMRKH